MLNFDADVKINDLALTMRKLLLFSGLMMSAVGLRRVTPAEKTNTTAVVPQAQRACVLYSYLWLLHSGVEFETLRTKQNQIRFVCVICGRFVDVAIGGFYIGDGVNFFDDVKDWSGLFFDAHQKLQSTSKNMTPSPT